jgi:hypothetical protein
MSNIEETKNKASKKLLNKTGISGVAVGKKMVNGIPTNEDSIMVFVTKKVDKDTITKYGVSSDVVPDEIDGIPTDIIEVGDIRPQLGFKDKVRPVKPGYSISHGKVTAGTLGGFFYDRDGDVVALSNFHVLTDDGKSKIGDIIYQPGTADTRENLAFKGWKNPYQSFPYIGTLKKFHRLSTRGTFTHDSAIAKIYPELFDSGLVDLEYPEINKKLGGFGSVKPRDVIYKCGRTTGFTSGNVIATNGEFSIDYGVGTVKFKNVILTNAMSQGGDSGSVAFDSNMNMVGLLFAGSQKVTLYNDIKDVVDFYGLKLINDGNYSDFKWKGYGWKNNTTDGVIKVENDNVYFEDNANHHCYIENMLTGGVRSISATVNTGTDKGATWGVGFGLVFPRGTIRINIRNNGTYGSYHNSSFNLGFGRHRPNEDYKITFSRSATHWSGEIEDQSGAKIKLIQLGRDQIGDNPIYARIGKMGDNSGPTDFAKPGHQNAGEIGLCSVSNFIVK